MAPTDVRFVRCTPTTREGREEKGRKHGNLLGAALAGRRTNERGNEVASRPLPCGSVHPGAVLNLKCLFNIFWNIDFNFIL